MEEKRKIIEIYEIEHKESDTIEIEVEKLENSEIANDLMQVLIKILAQEDLN